MVIQNPEVFSAIKKNLIKLDKWPAAEGLTGKFLPYAGTLIKLKGGAPLLDKVEKIDESSTASIGTFLEWLDGAEGRKIIAMWDDFKSLPKGPIDQTACPVMVALFKKAIGM